MNIKAKKLLNGQLIKHKFKLMAKGFYQKIGFYFTKVFSPVVKWTTLRVVINISLSRKWNIHHLENNNTFLNGTLQEEIYIKQSQGFESHIYPNFVCKLNKEIYDLKQAPRA